MIPPLAWAGDFMDGRRRFCPRCKRSLCATGQLYRIWVKLQARAQAWPLLAELVQKMASVALLRPDVGLAATCLVSFLGLLRSTENWVWQESKLSFMGNSKLVLSHFPAARAPPGRETEVVCIQDSLAVQLIAAAFSSKPRGARLLPSGSKQPSNSLHTCAGFLGVRYKRLTPYGLRRGGATWLVQKILLVQLDAGIWEAGSRPYGAHLHRREH